MDWAEDRIDGRWSHPPTAVSHHHHHHHLLMYIVFTALHREPSPGQSPRGQSQDEGPDQGQGRSTVQCGEDCLH